MAFGSAPVGVADDYCVSLKTRAQGNVGDLRPGKPTTDSGGKSSELTSAIQSTHQHSALCAASIRLTASGRIHICTACACVPSCRNCRGWYSSNPCKEGKQCAFTGGVGRDAHLNNRRSLGLSKGMYTKENKLRQASMPSKVGVPETHLIVPQALQRWRKALELGISLPKGYTRLVVSVAQPMGCGIMNTCVDQYFGSRDAITSMTALTSAGCRYHGTQVLMR